MRVEVSERHELDDDVARVDLDALWRFLSTQAYWLRWRTRDQVEAQLERSWRVVAGYRRDSGAMVGFARAMSDGIAIAYLSDVYVEETERGHGLGKALVAEITTRGAGASMRWLLHTSDAHGLYELSGFHAPGERLMERDPL